MEKIEAKCKKTRQLQKNTFKFLLLGSNGLLGNELKKLPEKTLCLSKKKNADLNIDLRNFLKLENIFKEYKFDNIINCLCYNKFSLIAKLIKINCDLINEKLPIFLNKLSFKYNFKLIHISTDQVYDFNQLQT